MPHPLLSLVIIDRFNTCSCGKATVSIISVLLDYMTAEYLQTGLELINPSAQYQLIRSFKTFNIVFSLLGLGPGRIYLGMYKLYRPAIFRIPATVSFVMIIDTS
jgi:hypothetical protein